MSGSIRITDRERVELLSNLATMLAAGIPLLEAVESLSEDSKGGVRKALLRLQEGLHEGQPISATLAQLPKAFDPITVNLVKTAEEAGTLETTLHDAVASLKKEMALKAKIKASVTYPLFVMVVFLGVILLILTFVIPRISKVFSELQVPLPETTKLLIATSKGFLRFYPFIIVLFIGLLVALVYLYKTKHRVLIALGLRLPGLRRLGREIDLAHFTRSMSLLLSAGIPVAEALELAKEVVVKPEIRQAVERVTADVMSGKRISEGLRASKGVIPRMMIRIVETAEQAGTLEKTMQELSEYFTAEVNRTLKTMASLLEPLLLVVIGVLVGGVMLAIIAPIYNLISQIGVR